MSNQLSYAQKVVMISMVIAGILLIILLETLKAYGLTGPDKALGPIIWWGCVPPLVFIQWRRRQIKADMGTAASILLAPWMLLTIGFTELWLWARKRDAEPKG